MLESWGLNPTKIKAVEYARQREEWYKPLV